MGIVCPIYAALYAFFAFLVARWSRGILPVAAALSMILAIFCAVGADSWFARDKAGFDEALLPSSLIGLLVVILAPAADRPDRRRPLRLQPGVARRGGAPDRLRRGLRRRRPARNDGAPPCRPASARRRTYTAVPEAGLKVQAALKRRNHSGPIGFDIPPATPAPSQKIKRSADRRYKSHREPIPPRRPKIDPAAACGSTTSTAADVPPGGAATSGEGGPVEPAPIVCHCLLIEGN